MKVKIKCTNVYDGEEFVNIQTVDVPSPGEEDSEEWAMEYLLPFSGTGRTSGYAGYFIEVLQCDDRPDLRGTQLEVYG